MAMALTKYKKVLQNWIKGHKKALTLLPGNAYDEIAKHNKMIDHYQSLLKEMRITTS